MKTPAKKTALVAAKTVGKPVAKTVKPVAKVVKAATKALTKVVAKPVVKSVDVEKSKPAFSAQTLRANKDDITNVRSSFAQAEKLLRDGKSNLRRVLSDMTVEDREARKTNGAEVRRGSKSLNPDTFSNFALTQLAKANGPLSLKDLVERAEKANYVCANAGGLYLAIVRGVNELLSDKLVKHTNERGVYTLR